jgi:glycosyltransferase involved in cell wall biosynthesis
MNAKILVAGSFDNVKAPFFSKVPISGEYQQLFEKYISNLNQADKSKVQFLGNINHNELNSLYNAADAFSSWSTFHDEDFGMSPAEAFATGLPGLISDWGGYADFSKNLEFCHAMATKIQTNGITIDTGTFDELLLQSSKEYLNPNMKDIRMANAAQFAQVYSPQSVSKILDQLIKLKPDVFYGFNSKITFHARAISQIWGGKAAYYQASSKDKYYFSNYSHYTGQN